MENNESTKNAIEESNLDSLDQEVIKQIQKSNIPEKKQQQIIATMQMYSGPIPHPDILKGYQALDPNAAKKIIDNGIAESENRRYMERMRQKRRGRTAWVELLAFIIITTLFIIASIYLILNNHQIIGSIFGGGSFLILMGSLISGVENLNKNDDLTNNDDHNYE